MEIREGLMKDLWWSIVSFVVGMTASAQTIDGSRLEYCRYDDGFAE